MGCVNRSSKEFKKLAQDNNVDSGALELITHKYWIEKGSEDSFPSNVYIQEQLGNVQYEEPGAAVRKLWEQKYSIAKEYSSLDEVQTAKEKALKFFPESAIVHYKDSKGNYILTVKQPVEKIKYSAAKPISEELADARKLDLGLDNTETYSIGKVRELFDKFNTDKESKKLADKVFDLAESLGLQFMFDESLPINTLGRYSSSGVIKYRKSFFERDMFEEKKAPVLLHEVIHAVSMYALSNKVSESELPKALQDFKKEITEIYNEIKDDASLTGERGILDAREMVAELSSPVFREKLKKIERDKETIWTKIVNVFKSLFGIKVNNPSSRLMKSLEKAMDAFDNDLYMRYSGMRGVLREAQRENEWQYKEMTAKEMRKAIRDHYIKKYYNPVLNQRTKIRLEHAKKKALKERKTFSYLPYGETDLEIPKKVVELRKKTFSELFGDLVKVYINIDNDNKKEGKEKKQPELVGYSFTVKFKTNKELLDDQNARLLDWLKVLDNMSESELQGALAGVEQEYADYEMLHPETKKKGSEYELQLAMESNSQKGAHPFTFDDGTQILAPFKLNSEQARAINALNEFVHSNETSITLSGYAGTGKTSLMELFAKKMRDEWRSISFCASTNKASIVLKQRVSKAGFKARTLNKVFGIAVEPNDKADYDAKNLVTKLNKADISAGSIVVIDEASMISDQNYDILNNIAAKKGLKLIYVGDPQQLAPPNQKNISKVFRNGNGKVLGLTKVERTGDNDILKEATALREGNPLSGISHFNSQGKGVAYMTPNNDASIDELIRYYVQGAKDNPDFFRILAYRNKTVADYNARARRTLGYTGFIPNVGEPLLGYSNWGYLPDSGEYRFVNSESYKVTHVYPQRTKTFSVNGQSYYLTVVPLAIEDSQGHRDQIDYIDIKGNENNRAVATQLAQVKDALWAEWRRTPKTKANSYKLDRIKNDINYIEQGLFINDNITVRTPGASKPRTLQSKVVDFGYAMTVHKSQGSTFTHVLMDDVDIAVARNQSTNAIADVMLGLEEEPTPDYANSTLSSTEDVDLQVNSDYADIRQQLEYVAMSRATDTVTVISNNVKVADSPLVQATKEKSPVEVKNPTPSTTKQETPVVQKPAQSAAAKPTTQHLNNEAVWKHMSEREIPKGRRETSYTPVGQTDKRTYTVENGHIYNKEGKEVYQGESADRNKILAQLALDEDRAVRVNYRGVDYVVDNNQVITSLKTGNIMKWGKENGDRKAIIELATQRFRDYITQGKKSIVTQAVDHLVTEGYDVGDEVDMQNYLANHPISSTVRAMEARKEAKEMDEIKAKAKADGTFMKAPNGKPTNLNERQWLQVRTKNFIKWFGDWINDPANASKVIDENGEPLVVWHGSKLSNKINIFYNRPTYFSNRYTAFSYTPFEAENEMEYMYPTFLNIRNPKIVDGNGAYWNNINGLSTDSIIKSINEEDGAIIKNIKDYSDFTPGNPELSKELLEEAPLHTDYVALSPNQIKSATDNNGMFSTENDDIQMAIESNIDRENNTLTSPNIQKYTTPEGEVYGFVDENGKIYLDRRVITAEHPMHEFTHLWDRMVQQKNPELWKRGIELMKQLPQWKEILEDENYGKKWTEKGMSQEQLDNYVASEVHSRLVGKQGETLLENLGKRKGYKRIINKLKEWIKDMWKNLHKTFGNWTDEELNTLTLKDFNRMTIRDFTQAKDFKEAFEDQVSDSPVDSAKRDATVNKIESYVEWQKQHITFDKGSHKYFFDGQPIDYSVTEYGKQVFGPKNIEGDHSYALAMGNAVDALTRDFFIIGEKALEKYYPNLTDERKAAIVNDLRRLKAHLDKEFHNNYKVITTEFPIAARISTPNGEKTVGGTVDMLIIDGEGNIHIFDMKAKNHDIDATFFDKTTGQYKTVDDRRDYTFQLNGYRQILEALFPEFKNKIVDLRLIWFDTDYTRQNKGAVYTTHKESGIVTVKEDGNTTSKPLAEYDKWKTPSLKPKVEESLLPLTRQDSLSNVRPIQDNWNRGQEVKPQQPKDNASLHYENYNDRYTPRESSSIPILNEKAAALRSTGWHIEFYDKKSQDGSITNEVMTISLGQRNKGFFELVKDVDLDTGLPNNDYSVHFKTKSKKGLGGDELATVPLTDTEKKAMFKALAWAIPDGANVSTWGELSEGGIHGINRFKDFGFTQTGTRKVKHKNGGDLTIPVFTKGAAQQANTQQQQTQTRELTSEEVYTKLKKQYPENSSERKLLDLVFPSLKIAGTKFKEVSEISTDGLAVTTGQYVPAENTIYYSKEHLGVNTLLHEAIHAVTSYYMQAADTSKFSKEINVAITEIHECWNLLREDYIENVIRPKQGKSISNAEYRSWVIDDLYGLSSPTELIAEISNPELLQHIRDYDKRHKGKNIFQRLVDAIANLFGINKSYGSLEKTLKDALVKLITSPNKELMDRYTLETKTFKENVKKINESASVKFGVSEAWPKLHLFPQIKDESNRSYADFNLVVSSEMLRDILDIEKGVKVPISGSEIGTIITIPSSNIIMTLNGKPILSESEKTATIPLRIYNGDFFQLNTFDIRKGANGANYITNIKPLFSTQQTNTQQQAQQQQIKQNFLSQDTKVSLSTQGYRKSDPVNNKDTAYVFTENAQANAVVHGLDDSWIEKEYPRGDKVKLNVSDMNGDNQAGVRAIKVGEQVQLNSNAFGVIVKKYQQDKNGRFIAEEGQFRDTDADFELFKSLNIDMFNRLKNSGLKKVIFPSQIGKGKAALPLRFAEWLQKELLDKFGIVSQIEKNTRPGYNGYGLNLNSIDSNTQQQQTTLPGPETKMDIWAGRGQQNPDLSNVAKRPFTLQLFEGENPIEFNSVEQAFQYTKFRLLSQFLGFEETKPFLLSNQKLTGEDYKDNVTAWVRRGVKAATLKNGNGLSRIGDSYEEEKEYIEKHIQKILSTKSNTYDFAVKTLGGKNGGYTISGHSGSTFLDTIWSAGELVAEDVMKAAMKASFQQNTNALKRLLATGDATLTHVKGGEWAETMPELLMEVRKELREEHPELMPGQPTVQQAQQKASVQFTESTGGYPQRTKENAEWSDVTLAFAVDFNTAGEKLTKRVAGNKYHAFSIANIKGTSGINNQSYITAGFMSGKRWASVQQIKEKFPKGLKINIAGNGIYTLLPKGISQEDVNDYIEGFLDGVRQEGVIISEVRSGGQTGVDEAGVIAALRLGIPASVHAPKGYTFRDKNNRDINNEAAFKNRFNVENKTQGTIKPPVAKLEKGTWSADHVYKELKKQYPEGTPMSKLVDMVFKALKEVGTTFEAADLGNTRSGRFLGTENKIEYNINAIKENTILHESIHAVTSYYLKAANPKVFSPEIQAAIEEIKECHRLLKEDFIQNHFYENGKLKDGINLEKAFIFHTKGNATDYGFTSPTEMVAEMSNPEFLEKIRDYDRRHKGENIFSKLVNAIATFFGLRKNYTTVEDTVKKALTTLITHPNKAMAEKYTEQSKNFKNNTKSLNESNRIIINNRDAVEKLYKEVPSDFDGEWVDTTLEFNANNMQLFMSYDHQGRFTWENAPMGSIMVYNSNTFFLMSKAPEVKGNKVTIGVRAFTVKGLRMNGLTIKRDEATGIDYVESMKPLFAFPVTSVAAVPAEHTAPLEVKNPEPASKPKPLKTVSLTNYEYYKNLDQDTAVDADWKIPLLKELDAKINDRTPLAELNDILDQMDRIILAEKEEDLSKPETEKDKKIIQALNEYERISMQINNLLDSEIISASEVRHVAELVINSISDNITALQTQEGLAKEQFPSLETDLDFKTATRREIVNAVGINRLIARAKAIFEQTDFDDIDTMEQASVITDNWEAIMILAADQFAMNEGFGIRKDYSSKNFETTKDADDVGFDSFDKHNDEDAKNEEEGDEQERWQVESRTIDVLRSMSELVRIGLHNCYEYELDANGQKVKKYSKWGIAERVNPRKAVNSILRWTQGALTLEEMVEMLKAKQKDNLWLEQLIDRLTVKEGVANEDTDFQSQFFGVMSKHFQLYTVVLKEEDGTYHSMEVNRKPALKEARNTIITQYQVGQHPLFYSNRKINTDLLGSNTYESLSSDKFNLHKAVHEITQIRDEWQKNGEISEENLKKVIDNIVAVSRVLGYQITENIAKEAINEKSLDKMTTALAYILQKLDREAGIQEHSRVDDYSDIFAYTKDNNSTSIRGDVTNFLEPITEVLEDATVSAFYDGGKMYQSYVTPSYLTKLMNKFHTKDSTKFNEFIENEYGFSEWYKDDKGNWRNEWLRLLATKPEAREIFEHKVELNFNKHNYMRNMTDTEYTLSLLTEYFSTKKSGNSTLVPAWFRMPMQSNKPSSEYVKFYSYRGTDYKMDIVDGLRKMFNQELSRIVTVKMRDKDKDPKRGKKRDSDFIKNFDTNGRKFNYLPFLNPYLENTKENVAKRDLFDTEKENNDFAKLLQDKLNNKDLGKDEQTLLDMAEKAIYKHMDRRAKNILESWEKQGILKAAKKIEGLGKDDKTIKENIENFLWNDNFAAKNILQLTIGDIAFYKDAEDLQKRLAQLHAPGTRANITATDYKGQRVSDGFYRTFILKDFDNFRSNIVANIEEVFDRKIAAAPEDQKSQLRALKESLVRKPGTNGKDDKGGAYWNINVADAQGFSSPSSYRKKAFLFGKWSKKSEAIYEKLLNGDVNYTDLETAFQPLKPFVYSRLKKNMGVEGAPITTMTVPFQAKNAEYLLVMADAIIRSEVNKSGELSRPNLLRAVYRVMEDSEKLFPTKGIDTVQFESAIKSGLQNPIDIAQFAEMEGGETAAYNFINSNIYKKRYFKHKVTGEVKVVEEYNTDTSVHETSYEDYCLQQEVPPHFQEHFQAHGSQVRMIIPSDLDLYVDENKDHNDPANRIYYEFTEPDGTVKRLTAEQFRKEYEDTISEGIYESLDELDKELCLYKKEVDPQTGQIIKVKNSNKRERNLALSKILQREILSSPRYGVDLIQACSIDRRTGEFRIPKGDPIQAKRIEQLINSVIKNRVNKQKIAGGPIVQVSNFGTSKQLHIRFKDKQGNILLSQDEFAAKHKNLSGEALENAYKAYTEKNQAGIAYFEVFAPMWSKDLFEKFADVHGNIDIEAIKMVAPELLDMVSYRIPTEDKYSCAPMRVVGFMPKEAGDAIMLPWELTEIDDSDFDVDKRYVMRKEIEIYTRFEPKENQTMIEAEKEYIKHNKKSIYKYLRENVPPRVTEKDQRVLAEIERQVKAEFDVDRRIQEKEHQRRLDELETKNSLINESIDKTQFSKNKEKNDTEWEKRSDREEERYQKQVDRENERFKLQMDKIDSREQTEINNRYNTWLGRSFDERIDDFVTSTRFLPTEQDDAITREIRRAYMQYMYKAIKPTKASNAKAYRNNKIIDMSLAVLTHERTADKILNPGGFEAPKRVGYMVAAYRNPANAGISWKELQDMDTDKLKELCYTDKDLTWADTQVQFYKQNSAAASLIGVFAVNKVAHATLESDGIYIAVDEICGDTPFTIGGTTFAGSMEIDRKFDSTGTLIGKTLGSLVSASADAVKDPILNLMNVNMTTAGMLNTMLRLGMPFEDAALFLSQDVIGRALSRFNRENLTNHVSLSSIIEKMKKEIAEEKDEDGNTTNLDFSEDSKISTDPITKEDLIAGLTQDEHRDIDYKVLLAFEKLRALTDAMRKPTFATRFNSISSAVGPLIIDNLILERKINSFKYDGQNSTHFYNTGSIDARTEKNMVTIDTIHAKHPILKAFAETVNVAKDMFEDMPAGSEAFRSFLSTLTPEFADKVYNDKKLFSQLSDFYQSYMLLASGVIDPERLSLSIEGFPSYFTKQGFKEKYPDNALIQAITLSKGKKAKYPVLQIHITGLDESQKEVYRNAWIDLHKENPILSRRLFEYCFFRAGIGFSPKTFMSLVPTYVKERIETDLGNGKKASYVKTYRNLSNNNMSSALILNQFIRNNWNNNKLVPKKSGNSFRFSFSQAIDPATGKMRDYGSLYITSQEDINDVLGNEWIKVKRGSKYQLWRYAGTQGETLIYQLSSPLGNNGEYVEMSTNDITNPMNITDTLNENSDDTGMLETSAAESDAAGQAKSPISDAELTKRIENAVKVFTEKDKTNDYQETHNLSSLFEEHFSMMKEIMNNRLKELGIEVNDKDFMKEFNKYC